MAWKARSAPDTSNAAMRSIGIGIKLTALLAAVLAVTGFVHTYLVARTQRIQLLEETTLTTLRLVNTIRRSTRYDMLHGRREHVHRIIENIGEQEGIEHVRIFNKEGQIIYSVHSEETGQIVDRNAEACSQCHDAEEPLRKLDLPKRTRVFESKKGHRTLAAIDVIYNEPSCWTAACHVHPESQSVLGVLDIGVSLEETDLRVASMTQKTVIFAIISTVLVCVLVGLFVQKFVNRPVRRLLAGTEKVAAGNLDFAIREGGSDEMGDLARSFNRMTEDLKRAHTELRTWGETLERQVDEKTRDLRLAQAQIIRAEKLSSLGMLAAGVAHELNSPLTGILTFAHLLLKKAPEGSREREDLETIVNETNRCAKIIRQLLDFAREKAPEVKPQDVHEVIDDAISLVRNQALFHDIRLETEFDSDLPPLSLDAGQMKQVFLNLLVNGGEAMSDGGVLTIRTGKDPSGRGVKIVFQDTGCGIPPETIGKIFDPFWTSKDVGQGTGLGLAVSYGIVQRHGGTIEVESVVDRGSTFTITLPAS